MLYRTKDRRNQGDKMAQVLQDGQQIKAFATTWQSELLSATW